MGQQPSWWLTSEQRQPRKHVGDDCRPQEEEQTLGPCGGAGSAQSSKWGKQRGTGSFFLRGHTSPTVMGSHQRGRTGAPCLSDHTKVHAPEQVQAGKANEVLPRLRAGSSGEDASKPGQDPE